MAVHPNERSVLPGRFVGMARELHCSAAMTDAVLYGALGATGSPLPTDLVSIDGSLVMALGLLATLTTGVLLSAAIRRRRAGRRFKLRRALQALHIRRAAI